MDHPVDLDMTLLQRNGNFSQESNLKIKLILKYLEVKSNLIGFWSDAIKKKPILMAEDTGPPGEYIKVTFLDFLSTSWVFTLVPQKPGQLSKSLMYI